MVINQNAVKKICHEKGKRVSKKALAEMDMTVRIFIFKCIDASNGNKTILPRDVANFSIKTNLGG